MAEILEESQGLESHTINIYRTAATVKGGRRFSFGALVVVGDRNGSVGLGYGKAPGVPAAIEKAQKNARKAQQRVTLIDGTIPHDVTAKFGASKVKLMPASPGTGVIAGGTVRAVLELAGVKDCLTKSFGSTNQKNLAKAALKALEDIRSKDVVAKLRQVDLGKTMVEEKLEAGRLVLERLKKHTVTRQSVMSGQPESAPPAEQAESAAPAESQPAAESAPETEQQPETSAENNDTQTES